MKTLFAIAFGLSLCFAQDFQAGSTDSLSLPTSEPEPEPVLVEPEPTPVPALVPTPVPVPAPVAALPKLSVAQALSGSGLAGACTVDFTSLLEKNGFDMAKFMKELPQDVAKTKLQLKAPFGKPKDSDKTNSGVTVGCIKALPESPAEIASLLKNISLKMGLDLAVDAAADLASNSIPANVPNESGSGGGSFGTVSSIILVAGGLGAVIYGVMKDGEVARNVDRKNGKAAVDAESSRNMSYGIGAALLAGGLIVYLVF